MEPSISLETANAIVADKPAPKVTENSIRAKIDFVSYELLSVGSAMLTLCFIRMANGFVFVGTAAPAYSENFDRQVGERYAYEDAFEQIWSHEGYLLREKLSQG